MSQVRKEIFFILVARLPRTKYFKSAKTYSRRSSLLVYVSACKWIETAGRVRVLDCPISKYHLDRRGGGAQLCHGKKRGDKPTCTIRITSCLWINAPFSHLRVYVTCCLKLIFFELYREMRWRWNFVWIRKKVNVREIEKPTLSWMVSNMIF